MHSMLCQPDILTQILQHCQNLKKLSLVSQVNKDFNMHTMHSTSGRQVWLELASSTTGFNAAEHINIKSVDFHTRIKLLICPWLSIPRTLPLFPEPLMDPDDMRIALHDNKLLSLWLTTEGGENLVGVTNARPSDQTAWNFDIDLAPPPVDQDFFRLIMPPAKFQLTNQPESRYFYQRIHKQAIAIIELNAWDMEHRNGIYFFQNKDGDTSKMLRHVLTGCALAQTSMIIRPMEMWMLTEERVLYFGPNNAMLPLTLAGRMDPALWMVGKGKVKSALLFLKELGITDINAPSLSGNMTLLHVGTLQNRIPAVRALLRAKANPEARDDSKMTCVMIAASVEFPDIIRVLCEEGGANPNATSHCNETALHLVGHQSITNHDMTKTTVLALLDCHADPNAQDTKGQTPLFSFAVLNAPSTVKLLCSRGANPMHRNYAGKTPLHALFEVCLKEDTATVLVKRYKADVDAQDNDGVTPLMLAAHARAFVGVKILLETLDANPLLCDHKGHDALWYAKDGIDAPTQARAVIRLIETRCIEWECLHG